MVLIVISSGGDMSLFTLSFNRYIGMFILKMSENRKF
jgi:hypothetical protein